MSNEVINMLCLFGLVVYCVGFYQMVRYINNPVEYDSWGE